MNCRTVAYVLPPLLILGCATAPELAQDHPANPDAAQSKATLASSTLEYSSEMTAIPATMDPSMKMEGMKHDGTAPADKAASPAAIDPNMKMEGMKHDGTAPDVQTAGAYYTCPMHPEVEQPTPGECPKCGMKLVKKLRAKRGER